MNKDFEITNFANTVATEKHHWTKNYWLSANAHDVISLQDGESRGLCILTFFLTYYCVSNISYEKLLKRGDRRESKLSF